jgi:multidrug efflux system membrane fusion protein
MAAVPPLSHGRRWPGRVFTTVVVVSAALLGAAVLHQTARYPRTDDAEILANFIAVVPQVEGRIARLHVRDNELVAKGALLFEIDERPYRFALQRALSEQAALEGQIDDEQRAIAARVSAVSVSKANIDTAVADVSHQAAAVDEARADVESADRGVRRADAEWAYARNNLHRLEPLLARQFVTVDQVDRARTSEAAQAEALQQARLQLQRAQAGLTAARAQYTRAQAGVAERQAAHQQAQHAVTTLAPLVTQRGARQSAVEKARYDLDNCRIYAPFAGRVTNLTIAEGAYSRVGQHLFTLIDARTWWAVANFREGRLGQIAPGMRAEVYVMSRPEVRFAAVVDSIGFGVAPDPDRVGTLQSDLPDVQRTIYWVHLATRYPVRVRVQNPPAELFRIGESAVVTVRGW